MLYIYFSEPGFKAVVLFRVADYLFRNGLHTLAALLSARIISKTGADIRLGAVIGGGLVLRHPVGVVIGHGVTVGNNCTLLQNVTLGERLRADGNHNYPTLGDRVMVCAGAIITGPVTVGNDSVVAANAVVLHNVSPCVLVAGIPATQKQSSHPALVRDPSVDLSVISH